jgi:hypothetical protein
MFKSDNPRQPLAKSFGDKKCINLISTKEIANGSRGLSDLNNEIYHLRRFFKQFDFAYQKTLGGMGYKLFLQSKNLRLKEGGWGVRGVVVPKCHLAATEFVRIRKVEEAQLFAGAD